MKVALAISIIAGVLALVWPSLPWHLLRRGGKEATCPLVSLCRGKRTCLFIPPATPVTPSRLLLVTAVGYRSCHL
jgi:hypothetical protein